MDAIPIALFWSIAFWALFQRRHVLLYVFFGSMAFGSFAALPTALTGGLTFTPTPIVAVLIVLRELASARGVAQALALALRPGGLLLLSLFWVAAGVTTLFMPRFFAGAVEIVPMRLEGFMETARLVPTTQNISQLMYVSIAVLAVFAFAGLLGRPGMRRHVIAAQCLGAALAVATGLLDFAAQYVPLSAFLEPFRTASYSLLTEVDLEGGKRVVGLMPEASSFGSLVLGHLASLYFFRRALGPGRLRDTTMPVLLGLLLGMVWLSTSSAAYLGLALFGAAAGAEWAWRALGSRRNRYLRRGLVREFWVGAAAAMALLLVLIARPAILNPMLAMIDATVLQKSGTSSFEERRMWTEVSWQALMATHGLGVGLGGTRASNFAVALASNAGLLAAACYFAFVLQTLHSRRARRTDRQGQAMLSAIRWSYVPPFATSLLIGTTPDFGLKNAFLYGLAAAIALAPARQGRRRLRIVRPRPAAPMPPRPAHAG